MEDVLRWMADYPTPIVVVLCLLGGMLYLTKVVVEKGVETQFEKQTKAFEVRLNRRSSFEEKVLVSRFELLTSFSSSLQRVMTDLNRIRSGMQPATSAFKVGHEIVPLTKIFEDLEVHRLVLGEEFYSTLSRQAQLANEAAKAATPDRWSEITRLWFDASAELRREADDAFGITSIRW